MLHSAALEESSSGAWAMKSRQARSTAAPCSRGYITPHRKTSGPTGWQANSKEVTTPKLPPPPRRAQKRSACSVALAVTSSPAAVTTSADRRLSQVMPYLRRSVAVAPAQGEAADAGGGDVPAGGGQAEHLGLPVDVGPRGPAGDAHRPRRRGRPARPAAATGRPSPPPSPTALPATLCPPPRTATASPCARAKFTASITSAAPAQRAITSGRRSIIPFQMRRAPS